MAMTRNFDWERETVDWVLRRRNATPKLADTIVHFFSQAFRHTFDPAQAWFGVHRSRVSLGVGSIWLASAAASGRDEKGMWLLVDQTPPVNGWSYRPTKSTQRSTTPLNWGHVSNMERATVESAVESDALWQAYANASRKIFNSPISRQVSTERQEAVGKHRLSDFWPAS